ncbi:MAG: hypothetical protein KH081_01580 [Azospirillum sp.]|nr:hypothetical protein [Azospirillum sp.]
MTIRKGKLSNCHSTQSCSGLTRASGRLATADSTSGCLGTAVKCPFENKYNCITQSNLSEYSKNSSNWWYKDKGTGLIFQGGKVNVTTTSQDGQTVFYPKSFSTTPMTVVVTPYNRPNNASNDVNYGVATSSIGTSSFKIRYFDTDTTGMRTGYVSWFAVGY